MGRTEKPVTGFRSRAGRTFRAKLRLEQTDEGKWRVEFDEEWAKEPPAGQSEEERAEAEAGADEAAAEPAERRGRAGRLNDSIEEAAVGVTFATILTKGC